MQCAPYTVQYLVQYTLQYTMQYTVPYTGDPGFGGGGVNIGDLQVDRYSAQYNT